MRVAKRPRALDDEIIFQCVDFVFYGLVVAAVVFPVHVFIISANKKGSLANGESVEIRGHEAGFNNGGVGAQVGACIGALVVFVYCWHKEWVPGGGITRCLCNIFFCGPFKKAIQLNNPKTGKL